MNVGHNAHKTPTETRRLTNVLRLRGGSDCEENDPESDLNLDCLATSGKRRKIHDSPESPVIMEEVVESFSEPDAKKT